MLQMKASQSAETPVHGAEVWPLSVAAYHVLGEAGLIPKRTELLYGFVYHKMPKSPFHSFLVTVLTRLVREGLPPGLLLRTEQPLTCADSEPEPDVALVRGTELDFRHDHPHTAELVIEICVSSHEYDRSKLRAYASAGVNECWLVLGAAAGCVAVPSNRHNLQHARLPAALIRHNSVPGMPWRREARRLL